MARENKISISNSPPPLSLIHRPTDSLIDTEGRPISSDRCFRQNEPSNIETNFEVISKTNTAHVKKTRSSPTITKPVSMPDAVQNELDSPAVFYSKSPKSEMMWDILKQLQSDITEIRSERKGEKRGRSPARSISRDKKRRYKKTIKLKG